MDEGKGDAARTRIKGPVRVTLPAAVAYDPERLKGALGHLLGRLGCQACCSGADILLANEREFVVGPDEALRSLPSERPLARDEARPDVVVGLAPGVKFDVDRVFEAVDRVIDVLGPHPCISGFDVLLRDELNVIFVNEQLEAQAFAERF